MWKVGHHQPEDTVIFIPIDWVKTGLKGKWGCCKECNIDSKINILNMTILGVSAVLVETRGDR